MKFGIFDHLDRREAPIHQLYRDRLDFAEACDQAGFYGYHIAEHHQRDAKRSVLDECPGPTRASGDSLLTRESLELLAKRQLERVVGQRTINRWHQISMLDR